MKVNIPTVIRVESYHEILPTQLLLRKIIPDVKCKEVQAPEGREPYFCVIYIDQMPSREDIYKMIEERYPKKCL